MTTLKQMYEELIKSTNRWSYYSTYPYLDYQTLLSETASYEFIKNYFQCGGKEKVFQNDPLIIRHESFLKGRSPHILSTFLLGILIAESLNYDTNTRDSNSISFKYLWFLACLYHDIGYVYENSHNCTYLRMLQTDGLDAVQEICNIKYLHEHEFKTYKKEYINIYLSNRAMCSSGMAGIIDHGIVGGLLLYDRLRKIFEQAWKKAYKNDNNISRENFNYNGLFFSNAHYEYYAKAADAIIAHNVWVDTLNKYLAKERKQHLKENKIDQNNEIAFILALADTLEPIKRYGIYILDMIYFEKSYGGFILSMPYRESADDYEYISNLSNWVNIYVVPESTNKFLITTRSESNAGIIYRSRL